MSTYLAKLLQGSLHCDSYTAVVTQKLTSRWPTCIWTPTKLILIKSFSILSWGGRSSQKLVSAEMVHVGRANVWWNANLSCEQPFAQIARVGCTFMYGDVVKCGFLMARSSVSCEMRDRRKTTHIKSWFWNFKRNLFARNGGRRAKTVNSQTSDATFSRRMVVKRRNLQ